MVSSFYQLVLLPCNVKAVSSDGWAISSKHFIQILQNMGQSELAIRPSSPDPYLSQKA